MALWILALELNLPRLIPDVLTRVARLRGVLRVDMSNWNTGVFRLVFDTAL